MQSRSVGKALIASILTVVAALATPASAQGPFPTGLDLPVSSDGTPTHVSVGINVPHFPSFPGSGRPLAKGERDDARATRRSIQESAPEVWRLFAHTPMRKGGVRSIIGADNRILVNPTTTFPARATVLVTFFQFGIDFRCSGWLIGPDTVVTAGHCVHSGGDFGEWSQDVEVFPGRNAELAPYGSCRGKRLYSVVGWTRDFRDDYDFGVIKLDCKIGQTTGWYGVFWHIGSLTGTAVTVSGYPGDKPLEQWKSLDIVRVSQPLRIFYQADTIGGVSGSPVYTNRPGCGLCALAVHAYGIYGLPPFSTNNHGARITQARFALLSAWRDAK